MYSLHISDHLEFDERKKNAGGMHIQVRKASHLEATKGTTSTSIQRFLIKLTMTPLYNVYVVYA